jgi:hypothetical protein
MQIHELNKNPAKINKAQVNEVDLVGPNSVFNVGRELGKQLVKDPRGLINPTSIGIAKQNAAAASAASSADALANPGIGRKLAGNSAYQVGGSAKQTTPQQQLAQVQSNQAVQQMVKNLAAQWKTQGVAVAGKIKTAKMNETATPIDPRTIKDPDELKLLNLFYKQQGLEMPQSQAAPTSDVQSKANQKLNAFATEFQNWASPKLQAIGVNLGVVMQDPWASKTIQQILTKLSVESLANPESDATSGLVEQFFNVAIATNQSKQQSSLSGKAPLSAQGSSAGDQSDQEIVAQSGVPLTKAQIESLGTAMRKSANGGTIIRDTGNGLLNAIARMAGFRIGQ